MKLQAFLDAQAAAPVVEPAKVIPGIVIAYQCQDGKNHAACQASWCKCPCHQRDVDWEGMMC